MKRLQSVLFLCAALSAFARNGAKPRPGNCVATCTGTNYLNYQKGSRYIYEYTTVVGTFLQGNSHENSGLTVQCLVNVEVLGKCHLILTLGQTQIKGSMSSKEELVPGHEKLRAALEKHPLHFSFQDGIIPEICPAEDEETWSLNIKRGILSVFQDSYTVNQKETVEEVDVLGNCPSTYKVQGSLLVKSKDLNRCSLRGTAVTSLQSVFLPDAANHQPILDSQLECVQSYKDGIIEVTTCSESNVFRPFSKVGKGAKTETFTTLKLLKKEEITSMPRVDLQSFRHRTLRFERENEQGQKTQFASAEGVAERVRQLCLAKGMTLESADLFMSLVFDLRSLSVGDLRDLWQRALFKCRDNWQPLVDTFPACGTEACISFLTEIILSKELDKARTDSFLWSLAFIPAPTASMITIITALMESPDTSRQTFLGASSLVHNFCSKNRRCQVIPEVQAFMKLLESYTQGNCKARESDKREKVLLSLKAIGNAGLAASTVISTLNKCVQSKTNLLQVRLAAIHAFRRIPCEVDRTALVHLYEAVDEDVELRIAAYFMLMKCPSDKLFEKVALTLRKERSSQVGSFVWTHLTQILETNDPLKQQLRESLPNDIISKDFDLEHWKYSSFTDVTFLSEPFSVGANAEATLVFSPKSFLPRSAMANLTMFIMGYAVNFLEVGIRVENAEYMVQKIFGHKQHPLKDSLKRGKNSGKKWRTRNPAEFSTRPLSKKGATPRRTVGRSLAPQHQVEPLKPQRAKKSCQNVDYNRMNEIETRFTKRMEKRKKLSCGLSMKIFGNELSFLDCSDLKLQVKQYSLDMAEIAIRLLKGQEVQYNRRTSLATEELTFSSISGLPIKLAVNASAAINIRIKGNVDLKQWKDFVITGFVKPSAQVHVSAHMGLDGTAGKAGLEWVAGMRTLTSLDGGIQLKKGQDLKIFLNTPQETMEIIDVSSRLYTANPGGKEEIIGSLDRTEARTCSEEEISRQIGWQICSEMSYPKGTSGPAFPFSGPAEASVLLIKRDKGLQQYLLEAAYTYIAQKKTWIPAEAALHFFMGTPQSDVKRDVAIDLQLNYSKRKLSGKIVHPKKMIKLVGEISKIKHTRTGRLEVLVDDKDLYYVKGWTNFQSLDGEQMFFSLLEAKFTKHGSPIILSGNITRVPGQKIAFILSLNNVMKETATVSVHLEQKLDEKQKQYTIEADTHLPRILGCQIIGYLQQRGSTWTSTLRARYGLFGNALNLQHECNMAEKIKREASPMESYKLQVQHEFHCTQITSYNHKLHLQHEENESRTQTQLQINYGKHWDEINNKKKIFITQVFKNDSSLSLTNYFMEFTLQLPEKQINYKTQLQHSHLLQGLAESDTRAKVLYNNKVPFQAGLQWRDTSKPNLKKWEGSLKLDTPWLYLQMSHKLNQPHVRAYQSSVEITTAKALSVKNLVIYTYYKNKGNKREGRIHIRTPSTTYLKASSVAHITESLFRSHNEVVTLWNLPVKNKILLESKENLKTFWFWIKHQKKILNFTANYVSGEEPKKRKILSVVALWTTSKSPPSVMQLIGQIEELKKEKMIFQNRASIQFRHPFKLPFPQNIVLQETFTVDKRKMHYLLEVKALVNEKEETVHTLTLGYQPEKPFVCVSLIHPYNNEVIPNNMEVCVRTRTDHVATFEAEATMKINKRAALMLHGQYQNKSTDADFWYLVHFDTDHSLQLGVPHTLTLDGELFMMQNKNESFNYGANCKFAINKLDTSQFSIQMNGSSNEIQVYSELSQSHQSDFQVYATARNYGDTNYNGTFYLHSNGNDLIETEFDVVNENKRNVGILGIKAALRQSLLAGPMNSQFQITREIYSSRFLLVSSLQLDEKVFEGDVKGSKEYQEGLLMSLTGSLQHNVKTGLKIPQFMYLDASVKQQNNTNNGDLKIKVGDDFYRLHLQNTNTFRSTTGHDLILTLTQNGSIAMPAMTEFKGQLELGQESRLGQACWQTDGSTICFWLLQVTQSNQTKLTGKVSHNLEELITTGLPSDGEFSLSYDHVNNNRTVKIEMQSGSKYIQVSVEMERTFTGTPIYQLTASLLHSVVELEKLGLPFSSTGIYHYQNLRNGCIVNVNMRLEKQHVRVEIEQRSTMRTGEVFLSLNHDVIALSDQIPAAIQVNCSGEISHKLLLGHCSGTVGIKPFEDTIPARFLMNGTMRTDHFEADFIGHLQMDNKFALLETQTIWASNPSIDVGFRHSLPSLVTIGVPTDNRLLMRTSREKKLEASLEFAFGECSLRTVGNFKGPGNRKEGIKTNWSISLMNRCPTLERVGVPLNLETSGSLDINSCNISIKGNVLNDEKTAEFHLKALCDPKYTVQGFLKHSVPELSSQGLPSESRIHLSAAKGAKMDGSLLLQSGNCKFVANGNLNDGSKAEWTWVSETDCQVLQNFMIPAHSQCNGSFQIDGCKGEFLTSIQLEGNSAYLELRSRCDPKLNIDATFEHTLPELKGIPAHNKLVLTAEKSAKSEFELDLTLGTCNLQTSGRLQVKNKTEINFLLDNKCKMLQKLGAPLEIDGSAYIVVNGGSFESHMQINVDQTKLEGQLTLKAAANKHEIDALLLHNIEGATKLGIPENTVVVLTAERQDDIYKRSVRFIVDGKQIIEDLIFIHKAHHISLNYKLTHNVELLKTLFIDDHIDIQVNANFQGVAANLEGSVHIIVDGKKSIAYAFNTYKYNDHFKLIVRNNHNNGNLANAGYPKEIVLLLNAQKTDTKLMSLVDIQYDAKSMKISLNASSEFVLGATIELNAEVQHTIPLIKKLGVPFRVKAEWNGMLKDTDLNASLKVKYEPTANLILHVEGTNQPNNKEFQLIVLQNIHLLRHLPEAVEITPKVNYSSNQIKGSLNIILDTSKLNVLTILTVSDSAFGEVLEMTHTFPQLKTIPKKLVVNTDYQKDGRIYQLSHTSICEDQELTFLGNYSGPFPKIFGRHEIYVDFIHPFAIPLPQQSQARMSLAHSLLSHQDDIVINWDKKDQVVLQASLTLDNDRLESKVNLQHPFKFTLEKFQLKCLSERREQKYNQKTYVAWNGGDPIDLRFTLEYKVESNLTVWDTCFDFSSGQLQPLLIIQSLHGCGFAKHSQRLLTESLELYWDDKKINQSFEYQNNRPMRLDNIWIAATFSNIFLSSCGRQDVLGRIQTDFRSQLNHYLKVAFCNMSNSIKLLGRHQRNRGEVVLSTLTRASLSSDEKHDVALGMSLRNGGQPNSKNYSLEMEWKASETSHLGLLGTYTTSALNSKAILEGMIDHREKIKLVAMHKKGCQQYYTGYTGGGSQEEGAELVLCCKDDGNANVELYHTLNQTRKEKLGHISVAVVNRSMQSVLRVMAQGCGNLVTRTEAKLSEIIFQLKHHLLKKLKDFDLHVWKFRKNFQHADFLQEVCGWMLKLSQRTANVIKNGGRTFRQFWKLSRLRQLLLHVFPVYLMKIQDTLLQLQGELKEPLATLKEAYYDVTLKDLDQEWKEKTEEYLEKIQSFVPKVVQDTWLLEKLRRVLDITKQAFDLATDQTVKWTEAKITKAASRIQKPLANLYKYSSEDCSVVVNVPLWPLGKQFFNVANVTNYFVETKLIKAVRNLYNINLAAEYYRLKRRMMDTPFEHQALLIGNKHYMTFDGNMYDFASKCSFLLAKDFQRNTFTVLLSHDDDGRNLLHVEMNQTTIDIYPGVKVEENCKAAELPLRKNGVTVKRDLTEVKVSDQNGATVSCDMQHKICSLTLPGWYHGISAGLFGTNDNEAGNEFTLPNHSQAENVQMFAEEWQIDPVCHTTYKKTKQCLGSAFQYFCKTLLKGTYSPLRNCFRVVDPAPFYDMCLNDMCESSDLRPGCTLAAAFVHLCNRNFVPLQVPSQCVTGTLSDRVLNDEVVDSEPRLTMRPADVLFIIEERDCNKPIIAKLPSLISSLVESFKKQGLSDVKFGFVSFGEDGLHEQHLLTVKSENSTSPPWYMEKELGYLMFAHNATLNVPAAVKLVAQWPFRREARKSAILLTCSRCHRNYKVSEDTLQTILMSSGIVLHVLKDMRFQVKNGESDASVAGVVSTDLFRASSTGYPKSRSFKALHHHIVLPSEDVCLAAAVKSGGAIFDSSHFLRRSKHFLRLFSCQVTRLHEAATCESHQPITSD